MSLRTLFINSGILGHRTVAGLLQDVVSLRPEINARHINLSEGMTLFDRLLRRALGLQLAPCTGFAGNVDLRRWRQELNVGLLASRRIAAEESRSSRFDVLHLHPQAVGYANLRRMRSTPTIISIDATQQQTVARNTSSLARWSYKSGFEHDRRVFGAAAAITATSRWAAESVATHYPECSHKLHVMPYPVRAIGDSEWVSERFRKAPGAPTRVLFMGGDFPRKGGWDLLAAWRDGGFFRTAALDLVTEWPLATNELPPGVRLLRGVSPYSAEWFNVWRRADLFVMPTRDEAFGMVFQEAAASGVPVVSTRMGAVSELVHHDETGLLVTPGNGADLIRAISTLLASAALRRRFGTAALAHARSSYSLDVYARALGKIVHSVGSRRVARC